MTVVTHSRQDLRTHLERRQAELLARRRKAAEDLSHRREPLVADFADAAVQAENDEALAAIVKAADEEIDAIERALARWQSGLFGICESCGANISAARIAAVPHAVTCTDCAETQSR